MVCAIHQPNLFPWLPFFQKMKECDVFVLLTHCQFEKNNFQNRFNLQGEFREWNTLSVSTKHLELIKDKKYLNIREDYLKIKNNLLNYEEQLEMFEPLLTNDTLTDLTTVNKCIILLIATMTNSGVDKIVIDHLTKLRGAIRLIDICKQNNCDTYLAAEPKEYLDINLFKYHGIKIKYQDKTKLIKKPILEYLRENVS